MGKAEAATRSTVAVSDLAAILSRVGDREITEDMIRADLEAGAPVERDGTVHVLRYAAWLLLREGGRGA